MNYNEIDRNLKEFRDIVFQVNMLEDFVEKVKINGGKSFVKIVPNGVDPVCSTEMDLDTLFKVVDILIENYKEELKGIRREIVKELDKEIIS